MRSEDKSEEIVITGIVSPTGWDESGIVESVCIAADDGKYYFPCLEDKGKTLAEFLRKNVRVRGIMSLRNGLRSISVTKIEMLQNEVE
jgi:hypothetical protein